MKIIIKRVFSSLVIQFGIINLFAQIGVNTENPQGIFHVDAKSNTVVATPATHEDDVVFKDGKLGLGILNPLRTVDVQKTFRYQDGNQALDRVLYVNENHDIRWEDEKPVYPPQIEVPIATIDAAFIAMIPPVGVSNYKYSNVSITLTKGVWLVYFRSIFTTNWGPTIPGNMRALLCSSNSGSATASMVGAITSNASTNGGLAYFNGYLFLSVPDASKTYYLWLGYISGESTASTWTYKSLDAQDLNAFYAIRYSTL